MEQVKSRSISVESVELGTVKISMIVSLSLYHQLMPDTIILSGCETVSGLGDKTIKRNKDLPLISMYDYY